MPAQARFCNVIVRLLQQLYSKSKLELESNLSEILSVNCNSSVT